MHPARANVARAGAFLLLAAAGSVAFSFAAPAAHSSAAPADAVSEAAASPEDAVGAAIDAILSAPAHAAATAMPDDFSAEAGYRPVVQDGMLVDPRGGCSSPVPLPARFDTPCKAHDLGYDLLRYARSRGEPQDDHARRRLDAQLSTRLHASCRGDAVCDSAATAAADAVHVNSMRQGYAAPAAEAPGLYVLGGSGAACAITASGTAALRRRSALRPAGARR